MSGKRRHSLRRATTSLFSSLSAYLLSIDDNDYLTPERSTILCNSRWYKKLLTCLRIFFLKSCYLLFNFPREILKPADSRIVLPRDPSKIFILMTSNSRLTHELEKILCNKAQQIFLRCLYVRKKEKNSTSSLFSYSIPLTYTSHEHERKKCTSDKSAECECSRLRRWSRAQIIGGFVRATRRKCGIRYVLFSINYIWPANIFLHKIRLVIPRVSRISEWDKSNARNHPGANTITGNYLSSF